MGDLLLCVDVGSTWTKALLVDPDRLLVRTEPWGAGVERLASAGVLGAAQHPTTSSTDVMAGVDAVSARLVGEAGLATSPRRLVCSSAGGGLRLGVVGYEREVTAEAGRRAGLSAGARVVQVSAGRLTGSDVSSLSDARADVVLLTGGTDGGDSDVLLHNAAVLARDLPPEIPVVVAGNATASAEAALLLQAGGRAVTVTANVLPEIGRMRPGPARAALRNVFLRHVIGGDRLSTGRGFAELVLAATPDAVLAGVEVLARSLGSNSGGGNSGGGGVLVLDIGGATTDVYSVLDEQSAAAVDADVAGSSTAARSVEGDLGMRWSAPGVLLAAKGEQVEVAVSAERVALLAEQPDLLPMEPADQDADTALARAAAVVAARRHGRAPTPGAPARPLRAVGLVVGSGGALRHGGPRRAASVLGAVVGDEAGRWHVPDAARLAVDTDYLLCALGLVALARE